MLDCFSRSTRAAAVKKYEEIDETLGHLTGSVAPLIGSSFVQKPPEDQEKRTLIYIWGKRNALLHDPTVYDASSGVLYSGEVSTHIHMGELTGTRTCTPKKKFSVQGDALGERAGSSHSRRPSVLSSLAHNGETLSQVGRDLDEPSSQDSDWLSQEVIDETRDGSYSTNAGNAAVSYVKMENSTTRPIIIRSLGHVSIRKVVCGDSHLLFLTDTNAVYAFGTGSVGQLGLGNKRLFVLKPERIAAAPFDTVGIADIAAGKEHSVFLSEEGVVYVCGCADTIGDACSLDRHVPTGIYFEEKIRTIAAGNYQTMVVSESNRVFVWGESFFSHYYMAPHYFQQFPPDEVITEIAIGRQFAMALSVSGRVFSWGDGTYGELGRIKKPIAAQEACGMRIPVPTELVLTDSSGAFIPKVVSIATGARHALLLGENGRVFSFGDNLSGQCGISTQTTRYDVPKLVKIQTGNTRFSVRSIAAGLHHSGAITTNNLLVLWGHSADHKLIYTAPGTSLLEERHGIGAGHMGVALRSGIKECGSKPRVIFSLLDKRVNCIALGDDFTVVVTGGREVSRPLASLETYAKPSPATEKEIIPIPIAPPSVIVHKEQAKLQNDESLL